MKSTVIFVLALAAGSIFGATVFGPVSYYQTTGRPNVYDTTFIAYDTTVACTLIVLNGDASGGRRLSSASVELNGAEIISESDFNPHIGQIVRVVSLQSNNSLHLRLRSAPGAYLTLSIHRPCDAFISLAIDTVVGDSACFSVNAGGWGSLTYSFDFDGDGTYDTTTSAPAICHTYEEPDTYLVVARVEDEIGCEAEDSEEVVIKELEYTFEAESLWSYDLSVLDRQDYEPEGYNSISEDGNFIALRAGSYRNQFYGSLLFYKGKAITRFCEEPRTDNVSISHNGKFAIVPIYNPDWECPDRIVCVDTLGNTVWECDKAYTSYGKALWSENDSLIGTFDSNTKVWRVGDIIWPLCNLHKAVICNSVNGDVIDSLAGDPPDTKFKAIDARFRDDFKYFYMMWYDSLVVYNRHFERLSMTSPILDCPAPDLLSYFTFPQYDISQYDNNIYMYFPFSTDTPKPESESFYWLRFPDGHPTVQAVCMDSLGSILWRKNTDWLRVTRFQLSYSGKYTLGYTERNCPHKQIALWNTQTNELLFERSFPQDTQRIKNLMQSKWCDIYENPENNHILIRVTEQDTTVYLYADGSDADMDLKGIILFPDNPIFGYKKEDNMFTLYKVRW